MKQLISDKANDSQEFYPNITEPEAKKILAVINKNNSYWAIAVNAYNLGKQYSSINYTLCDTQIKL